MPETTASENGSARAAAVLQTHLDHLEKPLRYATRQNFAHLAKLRDLEAYVQHHVQALQVLPLPAALHTLLQRLLQAMHGVDALSLPQKQERVRQAEQLLSQMRVGIADDAVPSPPPAVVHAPAVATAPTTTQGKQDTARPLAQPVQFLPRLGPKRAALLA